MGERALTMVQYGKEATRGTPVAADVVLGAVAQPVSPDRRPRYPELDLGVRAAAIQSVVDTLLAQNALKFPHGYFQALPVLLACGVKGNVSGVEQTVGEGDYLYDHTPSMTASNAPDSITLEVGDDVQFYEAEYVMFDRLKIAGTVPQGGEAAPVVIEAGLFGRQWTAVSKTAGLSIPSMELMNAALARLYIDATWAGRGTTEKTGLLRAFDIEILTGLHPKFHGDANQYFSTHGEGDIGVMVNLTLEGNSDADALFDDFQARTKRALQLSISGSQIGSGTNHNLTISVWGDLQEVIPLASEDRGNNLHSAIFHGLYDTTGAQILEAKITTDVAAI